MDKPKLSLLMMGTEPTSDEAAAHESWFRYQVQAGLGEAKAGHLTPGDDVEAHFTARRETAAQKFGGNS